jgi:hypothetical protein
MKEEAERLDTLSLSPVEATFAHWFRLAVR